MTPLATLEQGFAVTPADATPFATGKVRAVYVGGAGDVTAIVGGATLTFKAVPVGTTLWIAATGINATATTATQLLAML